MNSGTGGGISVHWATNNYVSPPVVDTCLIYGNTVSQGEGGGIGCTSQSSNSLFKVRNCTIVGNSATKNGGGIDGGPKYELVNCIVSGNTSISGAANVHATLVATSTNNMIDQDVSDMFVNPENGNYHLKSSAQAKGAGVTYSGIGNDLSDNKFSNPPSIGCYEYSLYEQFAIGWNAVHLGITPLDIIKDGELVYAYTAKSSEITVNEVTFSPWGSLTGNPNVSVTGPGSAWLVQTTGGAFNPSDIGI